MTTNGKTDKVTRLPTTPRIIPRSEHNISRSNIGENALKVLYRLKNAGYKAYLVGGGVRDLLLNLKPKDFDVVTDAKPEQVRELFRNCRLIGKRFRLAHVRFGDEIIEVSTFRTAHHLADGEGHTEDGRIIRDNVYGDIDDDVWRRDFTINAIFYNIEDFTLVDYAGGLNDIRDGQLRLIGDPSQRYREDPVRMLRAVRFAVKLGFKLHPSTEEPIGKMEHLLLDISASRLYEEFMKLFLGGMALQTYHQLRAYGLFKRLFPEINSMLENKTDNSADKLLCSVFQNTDIRISEEKPVTPGFLIAALLWLPMLRHAEEFKSNGLAEMDAIQLASDAVISRQINNIAFPRRFTIMAREIWCLQSRLKHRKGNRPFRLISHPRFRAAYDFLLLRYQAGEQIQELVDWWTEYLDKNSDRINEQLTQSRNLKLARQWPRKKRHRYH